MEKEKGPLNLNLLFIPLRAVGNAMPAGRVAVRACLHIALGALVDDALYCDDCFWAAGLGYFDHFGAVGQHDSLDVPRHVAEVKKDHFALVTTDVYPTLDEHFLP